MAKQQGETWNWPKSEDSQIPTEQRDNMEFACSNKM